MDIFPNFFVDSPRNPPEKFVGFLCKICYTLLQRLCAAKGGSRMAAWTAQAVQTPRGPGIFLAGLTDFDLKATFTCGQAFRWRPLPEGGWRGVALGKACEIAQWQGGVVLWGSSMEEFQRLWRPYFDLDRDYAAIRAQLARDPVFARAAAYAPGIRVLRQEPWEALCSFIVSQNNHIPRIQWILDQLCRQFGRPLGGDCFAFPAPQALAGRTEAELAGLRAGYRARYLLDAAQKVAGGQVDLDLAARLPLPEARAELMRILGVGRKVADCALLYGCGRLECFPADVWVKRALSQLFPRGLPEWIAPYGGIAQQYLFHYVRTCPGALPQLGRPEKRKGGEKQ